MVLVFAEHKEGKFRKAAYEAVTFGSSIAAQLGSECHAIVLGKNEDPAGLGSYGASQIHTVTHPHLDHFDSQVYSQVIAQAAEKIGARVVVLMHSAKGKALLGRLAVKLKAGSVSGANACRKDDTGLIISKSVFSGKAIGHYRVQTERSVISLMGNAIQPVKTDGQAEVSELTIDVPEPRVTVREVKKVEGTVPLPEADLVVSAGRGMKDPENWGIIEELASTLGAATACSRPVADTGWRPHHEHVGQTGVAIRPNLYIAVGISGAIQHLAGVNNSKTIVVINKDPEAPFFKAADYGVCADLFDVVPALTKALQAFREAQN